MLNMYIFTPCLMNFDMQPGDLVAWVIKHLSENNARKKKNHIEKEEKKWQAPLADFEFVKKKKMHEIGIYQKNPLRKIILKKEKKKKIHFDRLRIIHIKK